MTPTRILLASFATILAVPVLLHQTATFAAPTTPATPPPAAAKAGDCKTFGAGKCCSPDVTLHLNKEAIYAACGESDATFLGESGSKETCKFHLRWRGRIPKKPSCKSMLRL